MSSGEGRDADPGASARRWAVRGGVALVGVLALQWAVTPLLRSTDRALYDQALHWQALRRSADEVPYVLVEIDDLSIERLGRFPWRRGVFADLIQRTTEGGARVVGVDVIFSEAADSAGDAALADALAAAGNVVLASAAAFDRVPSVDLSGPLAPLLSAERMLEPLPELGSAAAGVGNITVLEDDDGSMRRYPLVFRHGDAPFPSMAQVMANLLGEQGWAPRAPVGRDGTLLINYGGLSPASVERIPFSEVLELGQDGLLRLFKDRTVFVSATYTGGVDFGPSPLAVRTPSTFAHVYALNTVLSGRHLTWLPGWVTVGFAVLLVLLTWPQVATSPARLLASSAVLSAGFLAGAAAVFVMGGWVLTPTLPVLAVTTFVTGHGVTQWRRNLDARRRAEAFLERFMGVKLRRRQHDAFQDKVQAAHLSILSLGLVEFASNTRGLPPEEVVRLIRLVHGAASAAVEAEGGTMDRVTGFGMAAYWGYPQPAPDGAARAVRTALDIRGRLRIANAALKKEGLPGVHVRMGIATGPALLADIGTEALSDFAVVGRLAGLADQLRDTAPSGDIHMCRVTREQGQEALPGVPFDQPALEADGFDEAVETYLVVRPFRVWSERTGPR